MDGEATGADRLQPRLAHRHPVLLAELLDPRRAAAQAAQQCDLLACRLMVEISMDQPIVGLRLIGLVGDEDGRIVAVGENVVPIRNRFSLRARAGDGDAEAHGLGFGWAAASFASRSLRSLARDAA